MILNETPVRTSKSFNINNIKIDDEILNDLENIRIAKDEYKKEENLAKEIKYPIGLDFKCNYYEKITKSKTLNLDVCNYLGDYILVENDDENNELELKIILGNIKEDIDNNLGNKNNEKSNNKNKLHHGIIRIIAFKNTKIKVDILNFLDKNIYNFINIETMAYENSHIQINTAEFGSKATITNIYNICKENGKVDLNSIFIANDTQLYDFNYMTDLKGRNSSSNINVKGVLDDFATKHFKGTINFNKGCVSSIGHVDEQTILLSKDVKTISLPMLLCTEEDVEGSHSSSSGKISDEELFYIQTRGFSREDATKLLIRAKFKNVLSNVDGLIRKMINNQIDLKLNSKSEE